MVPVVLVLMTHIPFAARALVGTIPPLAMVEPVTISGLVEDFCSQFADLPARIENIMQNGHNTFIVHCYTRDHAEWLSVSGLTFRTHQIVFKPVANTQWVKLTRVRYGTTENAIKSRLSDFGVVLKIRQEKIRGIGISSYSVQLELKKPVPSRIFIAQSPVNVFYRGQIPQCFRCEQTGHLARHCPLKKSTSATVSSATVPISTSAPGSVPASLTTDTISTSSVSLPIPHNDLVSRPPVTTVLSTAAPEQVSAETMDSTPSVSSASSGLTPQKDGKRLPKDVSLAPPAKRDKVVPSYVDYERDRSRCLLLASDLSPDDLQRSTDLVRQIPLDVLALYRHAFAFRHPGLVSDEEFYEVSPDFLQTAVPPSLVDLLADPLLNPVLPSRVSCPGQPVLPEGLPTSPITYKRYALLEIQLLATTLSDPLKTKVDAPSLVQVIDDLPDDLVAAYLKYLCFFHPELMSNAEDADQPMLLQRWVDRDFSSLF